MPILRIAVVLRDGERLPDDLARRLADAAGALLGSQPGGTWVLLDPIARERYAESETDLAVRPDPIFVQILRGRLPAPDALASEAAALADAVAQICSRPAEHVHIIYEPEGAGRVAFGGRL